MTGAATGGGKPPVPNDWRASLPAEIANEKVFEGIRDVQTLAKNYVEQSKLVGRSIQLPQKPEDWPRVWAKLGWPETPEGYQLKPPALPEGLSWDEDTLGGLRTTAHKLGLTNAQVQGLLEWYGQNVMANVPMARDRQVQAAEEELRNVWRGAYEKNVAIATRAAKRLGGQKLIDVLERTGAGAIPEVVMAFHAVGKLLAEDGMISTEPGMSPEALQLKINRIMAEPAYSDRTHPEHDAKVKEVQRLFEQLTA